MWKGYRCSSTGWPSKSLAMECHVHQKCTMSGKTPFKHYWFLEIDLIDSVSISQNEHWQSHCFPWKHQFCKVIFKNQFSIIYSKPPSPHASRDTVNTWCYHFLIQYIIQWTCDAVKIEQMAEQFLLLRDDTERAKEAIDALGHLITSSVSNGGTSFTSSTIPSVNVT